MVKTGIRSAAALLLVLPLLASDASAQKGGRGGGGGAGFARGGGGGAGFGRPGGFGGAGLGARSFSAPRVGGSGIGRYGGPGKSGIGSRPAIGGTGFARRSPGTGTVTGFAGNKFAPASARVVGASPRTLAAGAWSRPGIIRGSAVLGNRFITNRALRVSIAPTLYRGRFVGRYWPWWYGGIAIGWVGPVFWPYAYYDFFDYVFWPYVYDDFWPYAYDDVYFGIYGPYAYSGPGVRVATRGATPSAASAARRTATICSDQATGLTDLPIERISQTV